MSIYNTIMESKSFNDLKDLCFNRGLILSESIYSDDNSYIASIMNESNNTVLNINITESKFNAYILNNNKLIEEFENEYSNDEELKSAVSDSINTFDVLKDVDSDEILNEEDKSDSEYKSIPIGLDEMKNELKSMGDKLKNLSNLTDNIEMISIIMDLSNNVYSLALDVESAIESYNDITNIPNEEDDESTNESYNKSIEESKTRINVANAMLSVSSLANIGVLSESKCRKFIDVCKNLF